MSKVNASEIINNSKFNRFHIGLLGLCFFIILFDGYDLVVFGSAVPLLMEEWNLSSVEVGAMGSYGLFGMVFGAPFFGMLADKIGRRKVIVITLTLFSLFTLLCGFASNPTMFSTYRFLAGLGLGGIMPNVIALLTDYSPGKMRNMMVSIVLCGYSVGGMLAPIIGIFTFDTIGWEAVFWFAGLPLLAIPFLYKYLPESSTHLIRSNRKEELFGILTKINPTKKFQPDDELIELKVQESNVPLVGLFKEKRAQSTIMFWIAFFMCLLMVYGLNTWLPNLMMEAGYALNSSLAFLIVLQMGAIVGTLIIAKLCDRYGERKMLVPLYALGAVSLTLLGFGGNSFVIYTLVGLAGACTIGAQNIVQAYVSQYYPPNIRSTALGMASGVGRLGGMLGPILGGYLLSITLPIQLNFIAFAIPGLIAAIALFLIRDKHAYYKQEVDHEEKIENAQPAVSN
ncbi:MFS transporter [Oceanobacillus rekensis]|uniref:MFS transporter n=1 Tax=Oceanobacillus rekensis TaxID=937927 RepID=UPI000B43CD06|nr:aromatic acid/H+ symport family MFS transporter [Oceanobacillus rekensis]